MDWIFQASGGYERTGAKGARKRRRVYTFDLIDPESPSKKIGMVLGWTLTLRHPSVGEEEYAAGIGVPRGGWLAFFDPSAYTRAGQWFVKNDRVATFDPSRPKSGRWVGSPRESKDPQPHDWLYGWIHPPTNRAWFPDEELRRRFDVLILFEQEMLPRARRHPPFVRAR